MAFWSMAPRPMVDGRGGNGARDAGRASWPRGGGAQGPAMAVGWAVRAAQPETARLPGSGGGAVAQPTYGGGPCAGAGTAGNGKTGARASGEAGRTGRASARASSPASTLRVPDGADGGDRHR